MQKKLIICAACLLMAGCTATQQNTTPLNASQSNMIIDGKFYTSLYMQRAAEYKALCFQAYNLAGLRLQQMLQQKNFTRPLAIVTDVDETILDNTPYAVHQALQNKAYEPKTWTEWTARASADTICGAKTFFDFAHAQGVEIFYITNRNENERAGTLQNLQHYGFPDADAAHLILKTQASSKEERRKLLSQTHDILLFCGDNLSDFSILFDNNDEATRTKNVRENAALFGDVFIVLPNPNYGDWESAVYDFNDRLSPLQKQEIIRKKLKTY